MLASGDWNSYVKTGFYRGNSLANQSPSTASTGWRYVTVINHAGDHCIQYSTDFDNAGCYTRVLRGNVWSEWKNLTTNLSVNIAGITKTPDANGNVTITAEELKSALGIT
jgi:hypothetical protein